jgi:hypothetical protein
MSLVQMLSLLHRQLTIALQRTVESLLVYRLSFFAAAECNRYATEL